MTQLKSEIPAHRPRANRTQLQSRLAGLRFRLRSVAFLRGVSWLLAFMVAKIFISCSLDWLFHLSPIFRTLFLIETSAGIGIGFYILLYLPLTRKDDDLSLALKIEKEYPHLNDALASSVQFLEDSKLSHDSASMCEEAIRQGLESAEDCDFNKVVKTDWLRTSCLTALFLCVSAVGFVLWNPALTQAALVRLFLPFAEQDWPTNTQVTLDYPKRVAIGQPFTIKGKVTGVIPEIAVVEFAGLTSSQNGKREYPIQVNEEESEGTFTAPLDMARQYRSFRFRVIVNDARSPKKENSWHTVEVGEPPRLAPLNGLPSPLVELHYPKYTGKKSPEKITPGTGRINAPEGTVAFLQAATDRPIAKAWIEYHPSHPLAIRASKFATIGNPFALPALAAYVGGKEVWAKIPAFVNPNGTELSVRFRPWISGVYVLYIRDDSGLANDYVFGLDVLADPSPTVYLKRPKSNRDVLPDATISLKITAEDDRFGLKSTYLEYYRKAWDGTVLDPVPKKLPLYDHQSASSKILGTLTQLTQTPVPTALPGIHLKPLQVTVGHRWSLNGIAREGEILIIRAGARDFNNVVAFPKPGYSDPEIQLRIVSPKELNAILDQKQAKIQQNLLRLREWQEEALKKIIAAEKEWQNTGKLSPEQIDRLIEAEQLQKNIKAQIDEKEQGLRGKLARMQETLKDNNMKSSGAKDRIDVIKRELDRISQEHLPQIERRISNARQKLDGAKDVKTPEKAEKGDLGKAKEHQEEVRKSLDDLLQYLERWASANEIRGETREILKEQKLLAKKTKGLLGQNPNDPKWKSQRDQVAELQHRLGDKTQGLLNKMDRVSKDRQMKDPDFSDRLEEAKQIGEKNLLPGEMKDSDKQIREGRLNVAQGNQKSSVTTLEKMIEALQEKREEELERLIKKQKKAEKGLDNFEEKLEKLRKKIDQAKQIADPAQRQKALKDLAKEQKKLEEEVRKNARELSRLRAEKAAERMREAADQMARAAKKLEDGADPAEEMAKADQELKKAEEEFQDAQERAQNELVRERLVRIADQILGLKERQDQLIPESERLNTAILRGGWNPYLRVSLHEHGENQQNLQGEAKNMAKKIEGAKVFHLILTKAAENMKQSADQINRRVKKSLQHGLEPFPFEPEILKAEKQSHKLIVKYQKRAADRLNRLVTALKQEIKRMDKEADEKGKQQEEGEGDVGQQKKGGIQAQDGIPAVAQLKALRDEQQDLNKRTEEFAENHPELEDLTEDEQTELQTLHADQEALFSLFREMVTAANKGATK